MTYKELPNSENPKVRPLSRYLSARQLPNSTLHPLMPLRQSFVIRLQHQLYTIGWSVKNNPQFAITYKVGFTVSHLDNLGFIVAKIVTILMMNDIFTFDTRI